MKEVGKINMGTHSWEQTATKVFDFFEENILFLLPSFHLLLLLVHSFGGPCAQGASL